MSAKKSQETFTANIRVVVIVGVDVGSGSLEQATERARKLTVTDCVEPLGEHVDSSIELVGVSSDHWVD